MSIEYLEFFVTVAFLYTVYRLCKIVALFPLRVRPPLGYNNTYYPVNFTYKVCYHFKKLLYRYDVKIEKVVRPMLNIHGD